MLFNSTGQIIVCFKVFSDLFHEELEIHNLSYIENQMYIEIFTNLKGAHGFVLNDVLAKKFKESPRSVTKHLKKLKERKLIKIEEENSKVTQKYTNSRRKITCLFHPNFMEQYNEGN